jgi:hypothetical protein
MRQDNADREIMGTGDTADREVMQTGRYADREVPDSDESVGDMVKAVFVS